MRTLRDNLLEDGDFRWTVDRSQGEISRSNDLVHATEAARGTEHSGSEVLDRFVVLMPLEREATPRENTRLEQSA